MTPKTAAARRTFTIRELEIASGNNGGFCIACGAEHEGLEPDARRYRCERCDRLDVYGAEEIMLMGLVR